MRTPLWVRLRRGHGTTDPETGHWRPTWGPWHLMREDPAAIGGHSVVAVCGVGTYRAWASDRARLYAKRPPEGDRACRVCLRVSEER